MNWWAIIGALAGMALGLLAGFELGDRHCEQAHQYGRWEVEAMLRRKGYFLDNGELLREVKE